MSVLLFFNELSCSEPRSKEHVNEAMERFVRLLNRITQWRADTALVSLVRLKDLELAPGYFLTEWAGQPRHRDLWRGIRRMQNRAPFSEVLPLGAGDGADYSWSGRPGRALAAAHLLNGLLVSLLAEDWDATWVRADREMLADSPGGEAMILQDSVDIRHAAMVEHAAAHEDWIKQTGLPDLRSGAEIWAARDDLFPHLRFLPQVESHLRGLRLDWVVPVANELRRLDDAIADWDPAVRREPGWRSKVTSESESRKRLCAFTDLDGADRIFDWHGRFTPGAGRVYFRLVPQKRQATVAYIGLKLGV